MSAYNIKLQTNNIDLQEILTTINELPKAINSLKLQNKTVVPTITEQIITADSGFGGLKNVNVKGDSDLIAQNIVKDVNIFGITGAYTGENNFDRINEKRIIQRDIEGIYTNNTVTKIRQHAFRNCFNLTSVNFPACTTIGDYAFQDCANLISANFPSCTTIGYNAFAYCSNLTTVSCTACISIDSYAFFKCVNLTLANFPACTTIGSSAFRYCSNLTSINLAATTIAESAFDGCRKLVSLQLLGSTVCNLLSPYIYSTPINGYIEATGIYGSIYVPASLVDVYKSATNWARFSSRIVAIGTPPEKDELDENHFRFQGIVYQKEPNMTWQEWINSDYNTSGIAFYINTDECAYIHKDDGNFSYHVSFLDSDYTKAKPDDIIQSGTVKYIFYDDGILCGAFQWDQDWEE